VSPRKGIFALCISRKEKKKKKQGLSPSLKREPRAETKREGKHRRRHAGERKKTARPAQPTSRSASPITPPRQERKRAERDQQHPRKKTIHPLFINLSTWKEGGNSPSGDQSGEKDASRRSRKDYLEEHLGGGSEPAKQKGSRDLLGGGETAIKQQSLGERAGDPLLAEKGRANSARKGRKDPGPTEPSWGGNFITNPIGWEKEEKPRCNRGGSEKKRGHAKEGNHHTPNRIPFKLNAGAKWSSREKRAFSRGGGILLILSFRNHKSHTPPRKNPPGK